MDDKVRESLESFLNPDVLRPNLIIASLYIAAFEVLKSTVVDRIKTFYESGFDENGPILSSEYQARVLSKNRKSHQLASLEWLKESKAIDDHDIAVYERVKQCRNELAHEIATLLMDGFPSYLPERFAEMVALVDKIERWWIVNVEIATDLDFDGKEIDEAGIVPGPMMALQLMMDIGLGSDHKAKVYLEEFRKQTRRQHKPERFN